MNKEIAKQWIDALRSGEYKQGHSYLKSEEGMCCLGVLCEISNIGRWQNPETRQMSRTSYQFVADNPDQDGSYHGNRTVLPHSVMAWAAMKSYEGAFKPVKEDTKIVDGEYDDAGAYCITYLTNLNDKGASFEEIASVIERHIEEL